MDEDDFQRCHAWFRRQVRQRAWLKSIQSRLSRFGSFDLHQPQWKTAGRVAFAVTLPVIALLGVELEYHWDLYGERNPEGKPQLVAIDPERARMMLAPVSPVRDIDKFFAVDLGTFLISDLLADRRSTFRQGETMIAQCNLCPPHEDMVIECKIRDAENRGIDRIIAIATREMFRVNITIPVGDNLPPGDYTVNVETAGRHVMQKNFKILPRYGTVAQR